MIFKSSTVALVISAAFACTANASDVETAVTKLSTGELATSNIISDTDTQSSFASKNENIGVYLVYLSEKSALDTSYATVGNDRSEIITKIDVQQSSVMGLIRGLDATAVLTRKSRLTENSIYVQMNHSAATEITDNINVVSISLLDEAPDYTAEDEFKKFPFLKVKDVGDDITVAIVGNGIDYTHKSLGGLGTPEAYQQAWANRSNAWDGFPTDTVIGGLDFSASSEGYHSIDYNPIATEFDENVEAGFLPSGTAMAAQVLAQAPDAKILFYKTFDWAPAYYNPVLDVILDPNQDGDISDRPDIIVLNSFGNAAFYEEKDTNGSFGTRDINLTRRLSAAGSLVVVGAGNTGYQSFFNLAWRAATPEALTVGSVNVNAEDATDITLSTFTPAGPVRGMQLLKPEVVAPAENIWAPVVASGDAEEEHLAHHSYAAAYAAGTAARILAQYPQLSPAEAKALVANTALSSDIKGSTLLVTDEETNVTTTIKTVAEVPFMGSGLVDGANAITANAVVWENDSYQPGLAFGFVEATSSASVNRDLTIKNLTNEVQSYQLTNTINGDKTNNNAIRMIFPETISIPANHSVTFPVTLMVDAEQLGQWLLKSTDDYTIDNWVAAAVNGNLVFKNTNQDSAVLTVPWQVFPKNNSPLNQTNIHAVMGIPYEAAEWIAYNQKTGGFTESQTVELTNTKTAATTVYALPMMYNVAAKAANKVNGQGHLFKNIAATIAPEAMCESGQKLSVAMEMFDNFDLPMAEHFDKAGHVLAFFSIYNKQVSDTYSRSPKDLESKSEESEKLAHIQIIMDENGQPQTKYIDYNLEYEYWNPNARVRYSKLGAEVAVGDDIAVANVCLDELYHHDFQSVAAWNEKLGWQFATDRDAQSTVQGPVIRYNPVINGDYFEEIIDHTGQDGYPYWWDTNCQPQTWDANYCIEQKNIFLSHSTAITALSADEDITPLTWTNNVTLLPGESARVSVAPSFSCNANVFSINTIILHQDCPPGVMVFEIGTDNTRYSSNKTGLDPSVVPGQSFSIYENAENGTVIGQIASEALHLFFPSDGGIFQGEMYMVNAIPGTPFAVSTDGVITVANSTAIDYEKNQSVTIKVHLDYVNRDSDIEDVIIKISNRNDLAPVQVSSLAMVETSVGEQLMVDVSAAFADAEGDGITFTATELPSGLTMSLSGQLSGQAEQAGTFIATVIASDGVNSTTAPLTITVSQNTATPAASAPAATTAAQPAEDESNGGSTSLLFILFTCFGLAARRANK